jgi:hypothetical protein
MPTSVGVSLIAFGAVLTSVSDWAGSAVALVGVAWEGFVFLRAGR